MPLTLEAPGATPEQVARSLDTARDVLAAAGIGEREAWAELAAVDACLGPRAESGRTVGSGR
jgi:hypothetical protein